MTQECVLDIPAEIDVTTVRVPEHDAICVEAGETYVTVFGDGRVCVVSNQPVDIATPDMVKINAPAISIGKSGDMPSS